MIGCICCVVLTWSLLNSLQSMFTVWNWRKYISSGNQCVMMILYFDVLALKFTQKVHCNSTNFFSSFVKEFHTCFIHKQHVRGILFICISIYNSIIVKLIQFIFVSDLHNMTDNSNLVYQIVNRNQCAVYRAWAYLRIKIKTAK